MSDKKLRKADASCLILAESQSIREKVKTVLSDTIHNEVVRDWDTLFSRIRSNNVRFIVASCLSVDSFHDQKLNLVQAKRSFPSSKLVLVIDRNIVDLILLSSKLGINIVIDESEIGFLNTIIDDEDKTGLPVPRFLRPGEPLKGSLKRALHFIQENYVALMGVKEVAEYVGVTESTLSRIFKNYYAVGPKRVLMYFKVVHALKLMENPGFYLKEIAHLSGFSNERRFNECFHSTFGVSPSECRESIKQLGVSKILSELDHRINSSTSN